MFESPIDTAAEIDAVSSQSRPLVAIIGGGASGALVALHLAARPGGPRIRLFERRPDIGRGVAYGAAGPDHLLNVRSSAMSAFQEQPDHFVDWLRHVGAPFGREDFAPRRLYGPYLGDLVRIAMDQAAGNDLIIDHDDVAAARPSPKGWRLTTRNGRIFSADIVVLATGHALPEAPAGLDPALGSDPRYVGDPWDGRTQFDKMGERVLILGTGLTMVDAALSLAVAGRRITAISRRGLTPRAHAEVASPSGRAPLSEGSPLAFLREIRRASHMRDWRAVVDSLRANSQAIWRSWSPAQRSSFLRHARCWWDVHRHRVAPEAALRIAELRSSGTLDVRAANVRSLSLAPDGIEACWVGRRSGDIVRDRFHAVLNCTGRRLDLYRSGDRLIRQMHDAGLIRSDPSGFGLDLDDACRPLGAGGTATIGLYAVGSLTQGRFWEVTAVPDMRVQVDRLAEEIRRETAGARRDRQVAPTCPMD